MMCRVQGMETKRKTFWECNTWQFFIARLGDLPGLKNLGILEKFKDHEISVNFESQLRQENTELHVKKWTLSQEWILRCFLDRQVQLFKIFKPGQNLYWVQPLKNKSTHSHPHTHKSMSLHKSNIFVLILNKIQYTLKPTILNKWKTKLLKTRDLNRFAHFVARIFHECFVQVKNWLERLDLRQGLPSAQERS